MKKLGIVGGLGPLASALFFQRLTLLTRVESDQQHIETILYSAPSIPDRSAFLTGKSVESPLPGLISVCMLLEKLSDIIAMPCMTAHHFYDELSGHLSVQLVDMHRVCAESLKVLGISAVGIMATDGTIVSRRFQQMLNSCGIGAILPEKSAQETVMRLIYDIKVGKAPDPKSFDEVANTLSARGAQKILLACTELSVYMNSSDCGASLCDTLDLLAMHCIRAAGGTPVDKCT